MQNGLKNKIFINSLPKSGTNLVSKFFELTGYEYKNVGVAATLVLGKYPLIRQILRGALFSKNPVIIGQDLPVAIRSNWLDKKLNSLENGEFITGHANYTDHLHQLLMKNAIKSIQVIRDPRDVLLSYIHYVGTTKTHFMYDSYHKLDFNERLLFTINGGVSNNLHIESFNTMLHSLHGWFDKQDVFIIRFEDIIGDKGGGSIEKQYKLFEELESFLDEKIDKEYIIEKLFGGTHTFRKGMIGSWKEEFDDKQKSIIHHSIGEIIKLWGYHS